MEACGSAAGTMIHLHGGSLGPDNGVGSIRSRLFFRRRRAYAGGGEAGGFSDDGHLRYYARCRGMAVGEKRRKLIKKLSKDLEVLIRIEDECKEGVVGVGETVAYKGAADNLLAELAKKRVEEKLMKKMKKMKEKDEEKAMNNMKKKKTRACVGEKDTSSSSSSESSDSSDCSDGECEGGVDILSLGDQANLLQIRDDPMGNRCSTTSNRATNDNGMVHSHVSAVTGEAQAGNKIEVCVGGKCRRSGALRLMEEFSEVVGKDGAVVGCKCMGKCKEGPNVRVLSRCNEEDAPMPLPSNPLCIGVGLEDVPVIVWNYLRKKNGMALLSAA